MTTIDRTQPTSGLRRLWAAIYRRPRLQLGLLLAPPIRALLPGRCFRYEAIDASHGSEFFQVEGLMIDEGTTLGDLRGLLDEFAHAMFGAGKRTRFRPGYYPFTEPSVAFDVEGRRAARGWPAPSRRKGSRPAQGSSS